MENSSRTRNLDAKAAFLHTELVRGDYDILNFIWQNNKAIQKPGFKEILETEYMSGWQTSNPPKNKLVKNGIRVMKRLYATHAKRRILRSSDRLIKAESNLTRPLTKPQEKERSKKAWRFFQNVEKGFPEDALIFVGMVMQGAVAIETAVVLGLCKPEGCPIRLGTCLATQGTFKESFLGADSGIVGPANLPILRVLLFKRQSKKVDKLFRLQTESHESVESLLHNPLLMVYPLSKEKNNNSTTVTEIENTAQVLFRLVNLLVDWLFDQVKHVVRHNEAVDKEAESNTTDHDGQSQQNAQPTTDFLFIGLHKRAVRWLDYFWRTFQSNERILIFNYAASRVIAAFEKLFGGKRSPRKSQSLRFRFADVFDSTREGGSTDGTHFDFKSNMIKLSQVFSQISECRHVTRKFELKVM